MSSSASTAAKNALETTVENILLDSGVITPADVRRARSLEELWGEESSSLLVALGLVTEAVYYEALSVALDVPRAELPQSFAIEQLRTCVPLELAERERIIPLAVIADEDGEKLSLGMVDPSNKAAVSAACQTAGMAVKVFLITPNEAQTLLKRMYLGDEAVEVSVNLGSPHEVSSFSFRPQPARTWPQRLIRETVLPMITALDDSLAEQANHDDKDLLRIGQEFARCIALLAQKGVLSTEEISRLHHGGEAL